MIGLGPDLSGGICTSFLDSTQAQLTAPYALGHTVTPSYMKVVSSTVVDGIIIIMLHAPNHPDAVVILMNDL